MIAEAFAYAAAVALLVGLAAVSVERFAAELDVPRRFAWFGAYVAALAFPVVSLLWAAYAAEGPAPTFDVRPSPPPAAAAFDWDGFLLRLWAGTTVVLGTLYAAAWARLVRNARRWPSVQDDGTRILVADDVGPAVLGVRQPLVILPAWLMAAPAALRSTVLKHEREHIAARDQVSLVAAQAIAILLPWNLPLWWFAKRLRAALEVDCDARVLCGGIDPEHYAHVLLAVGQRCAAPPYGAAALVEPVTRLERRIRIMLTKRPRSATSALGAAVITAVIAACATQLDPPVVATSSPAFPMGPPLQIATEMGPARLIVDDSGSGAMTLSAPRIVMTFADPAAARGTTNRVRSDEGRGTMLLEGAVIGNGDTVSLEGNVRFELDGTSVTASRASAKREPNGTLTLTLDDATVMRAGANAAPSSGE